MDSYEEFMNEYVEFMKKYSESGNAIDMLGDYTKYMSKYAEMAEKIDAVDEDELNNAELAYYIDVTSRVSKKLLEIAQ